MFMSKSCFQSLGLSIHQTSDISCYMMSVTSSVCAVQNPTTLRLGASNGSTTIRLANLGSSGPLLLSYGLQPVLFTNSTHTILYSVGGSSSLSLSTNEAGSSVITVSSDIINIQAAQVGITGNVTFGNDVVPSATSHHSPNLHEAFLIDLSDATVIDTYYANNSQVGNYTQVRLSCCTRLSATCMQHCSSHDLETCSAVCVYDGLPFVCKHLRPTDNIRQDDNSIAPVAWHVRSILSCHRYKIT